MTMHAYLPLLSAIGWVRRFGLQALTNTLH